MTLNSSLCNQEGQLNRKSFELAIRLQLQEYSQRLLSNKMQHMQRCANENTPILLSLKMSMMEIMDSAAERRIAHHTGDILHLEGTPLDTGAFDRHTPDSSSGEGGGRGGEEEDAGAVTPQLLLQQRGMNDASGVAFTGRKVRFGDHQDQIHDQSASCEGRGGVGGGVLTDLLEQMKLLREEHRVSHRNIEMLQQQVQQQSTQMAASRRSVETLQQQLEAVTETLPLHMQEQTKILIQQSTQMAALNVSQHSVETMIKKTGLESVTSALMKGECMCKTNVGDRMNAEGVVTSALDLIGSENFTENGDSRQPWLPTGWVQLWSKTKQQPYYRYVCMLLLSVCVDECTYVLYSTEY